MDERIDIEERMNGDWRRGLVEERPWMEERMDGGVDGWRRVWMRERIDGGEDGRRRRRGWIEENMDGGEDGCRRR